MSFLWTSLDPLQSRLYSNTGTLYWFDTVNNTHSGKTITTLYRSIKQGKDERIARLEWGPNYALGRAAIGRNVVSMGDLALPAGPPYWRSFLGPDGRRYTWHPDIDMSSGEFVLEDSNDGIMIARIRPFFPPRKFNFGEVYNELWLMDRLDSDDRVVPLSQPLKDMVCLTAMLNRVLNQREV